MNYLTLYDMTVAQVQAMTICKETQTHSVFMLTAYYSRFTPGYVGPCHKLQNQHRFMVNSH